jgi:hypothetical protein
MENSANTVERRQAPTSLAIRSRQEEYEEKMIDNLDKQLKCVGNVVEQRTQEHREELNRALLDTRRDIGVA